MPNYDYICSQCGHRKEIFQKMSDQPVTECPQCHQSTFRRGPGGGIGLQFQGSGFYITDYPSSPKQPTQDKPSSPPSGGCGCGKSSCKS